MGLNLNSKIVTDGLILYLDAKNRKSSVTGANTPLLNGRNWTTGSGDFTGFSQNGSTVENERIFSDDPWGNQSVVWETRPTGTTDADGGWNSSYYSIDKTKLYRFSVWVRRTTSSSGGTFYLGTGAGGQEVMRTDNGAEQGNPYWECEGTGALTQNVWYLVCGHIYPYFTTVTGRHPETGMFTIANGPTKVRDVNGCNIGQDLKWAPSSTSALHRTYHYYCGDNTTRLQFAFPRIDLCDGSQPSIQELLTAGESRWMDLSGRGNHHEMLGGTPSNVSSAFPITESNYFKRSAALTGASSTCTVVMWYKTSDSQELWVRGNSNNSYYLSASAGGNYYHENCGSPTNYIDTNVVTNPSSYRTNAYHMWEAKNVNFSGWSTFEWFGYPSGWAMTGTLAAIMVYNRALTAEESRLNFNALRSRYGI